MAIALVAHAVVSGANKPVTTAAIDTTGANLIVVVASTYQGFSADSRVVSDSKSNTWTNLTAKAAGTVAWSRISYCVPSSVGSSHTFSFDGRAASFYVAAFSGASATPFDQQNGATNATSLTIQPGSILPSADNALVVTGESNSDNMNGGVPTIDSGFSTSSTPTLALAASNGVYEGGGLAYLIQGTAASVNPTWTNYGTATYDLAAVIASFLAATGGGGGLSVTPGQGALKITGQAPSVSVTQKQSVAPGKGALAITGFAPRLRNSSLDISKAPAAGALKFTGFAPTVTITAGRTITPNAATLVITGKAPTVSKTAKWFTAPGQAAIVINGFPPSVSIQAASPKFVPASASIVLTGFAPSVVNSGDVSLARAQTVAGGRRPRERYALTYKGEMLVFDTMQALYDWFLALDERETQGVKKKQSGMPSESFGSARQSQRLSLRRSRSEAPIRRSGTRSLRSRSTYSVSTTRP